MKITALLFIIIVAVCLRHGITALPVSGQRSHTGYIGRFSTETGGIDISKK